MLTDNGMAFADLPKNRDVPADASLGRTFRPRLHHQWHRAQADQTLPSLDPWSGRANEPNNEGCHGQGLPYNDLESLKAHVLAFVAAYNSPSTSRLCDEKHPIR
ncbi:Integrase catalytic region (fragment) [Mesorhizobium prunaredense]|uniref:Integrase catalytic region n=1 Tax=Mesorhizobium prunaredense TaxID=1631249 RepID=A0A1R3V4B5_9HYPH